MLRPWLELARISNLPTVWTNVLTGWLLAGGAWQWGPLAWLLVGGSLLYTAGMILNDAMDVKFDREHRKERPIPSGRVSVKVAWVVGVAMLVAGGLMCYFGAAACGWLVLALVAAIVAYDAFHKPWAGSVLIMGSCRALLYLVAGSAVAGGSLSWETNYELVIKAVALGSYVVGVSLAARAESKAGGFGGWGRAIGWICLLAPCVAHFGAMVAGTLVSNGFYLDVLAIAFFRNLGTLFDNPIFWGLLIAFVVIVVRSLMLMRRPPPSNIGRGVGFLLAGIVVVDGLAICDRSEVAIVFAVSMPLLLLWQRKIAAT